MVKNRRVLKRREYIITNLAKGNGDKQNKLILHEP